LVLEKASTRKIVTDGANESRRPIDRSPRGFRPIVTGAICRRHGVSPTTIAHALPGLQAPVMRTDKDSAIASQGLYINKAST
jgi:hypothetical protein